MILLPLPYSNTHPHYYPVLQSLFCKFLELQCWRDAHPYSHPFQKTSVVRSFDFEELVEIDSAIVVAVKLRVLAEAQHMS